MATFTRPTFTQILDRVKADIDSRLPGADTKLRRSVLSVIAYVVAGVTHGLYGFLSWIALQVFPDTAEIEFLNRWSAIWGVIRRAASKATGSVIITGVDGTVIEVDTELQRSDNVVYLVTEEQTIASGTATVPVEAVLAGEDGNADEDTVLEFVSPLEGADTETLVDSDALTGGQDEEDDESLLARLLDRIQNPPHGGSENDYIQWAMEVPGVTRVWVYPLELGLGGVSIRFMMDDTYDDGIPESGDVTTMQNYIEDRRPVTADVTVVAPVAVPLDFEIHLNLGDTAETRAAVEANLRDLILRDGEPAGTIYLSRINEAISLATGEYDHVLSDPLANVTHTTGQIATMGDVTWI